MTAPTRHVGFAFVRAAVRATGILHVCSQRNSGVWVPVCGSGHIRSRSIEVHTTAPADVPLCGDCAGIQHGPTGGASLLELPVAAIRAGTQVRRDPGDLEGLAASITQHGVLTPILVRRHRDRYVLVAGARRLAAARAAGLPTIPALVRDTGGLVESLVENLHRQDLNPIEQAHAYVTLTEHMTQQQVADTVGVSRPQVANTIRLLALETHLQDRIAARALTAAHGRALLRIEDAATRNELARRIEAEGLSTKDADTESRTLKGSSAETSSSAGSSKLAVALPDLSALLARALGTSARVTAKRIVIDVDDPADLARILHQLGINTTTEEVAA